MIEHEVIPVFGQLWWQSNVVTVLIITLVIMLGRRSNPDQVENLARIIGLVLIAREVLIHPYLTSLGKWDIKSCLPLQMCSISAILAGLIMFWRNQWLYEFLYYWGIPGAFHSLLTPEFTLGTEGILFMEYYLAHGGIMLGAFYATLVLGFRPRQGSWWKIALWSQVPIAIVAIINWIIDANYMYLCAKPIAENPLVIGEWPWYILILEAVGLVHFIIVYLPYGLKYYRDRQKLEVGVV